MSGHIPCRPRVAVMLCISTKTVWHGNKQNSIRLEPVIESVPQAVQVMNVLNGMPGSDHIGTTSAILGFHHVAIKMQFLSVPGFSACKLTLLTSHHIPSTTLHVGHEVSITRTHINESAACVVIILDKRVLPVKHYRSH